jgi:hypothetical protein
VIIENVDYKKFIYPWFVSGSKNDFDMFQIETSYMYKEVPLRMFNGFPIITNYMKSGKLAKIQGYLPFGEVIKSRDVELRSIEDIKKEKPEKFYIWRVDGGADYELIEEQPKVFTVDIYDYSLSYIYDIKSGVVWPYYFLKGNTLLSTGAAKVTLIISATR